MNDEESAFRAAVIAQPDDDTVRLAFADWLQENAHEARAEFVRVQVRLARSCRCLADWRRALSWSTDQVPFEPRCGGTVAGWRVQGGWGSIDQGAAQATEMIWEGLHVEYLQ